MNWYEIVFILVAIAFIAGGTGFFVNSNRIIAAIIYFVLSIVVFSLYGKQWFGSGGKFAEVPVTWPPYINTCPDYLTYYERIKSDKSKAPSCIDTIGISKNGALQKFPSGGSPPEGDSYYFPLIKGEERAELCKRVMQYGLTWEGVYDGESCISSDGSGSSVGPAPASSNCPSK